MADLLMMIMMMMMIFLYKHAVHHFVSWQCQELIVGIGMGCCGRGACIRVGSSHCQDIGGVGCARGDLWACSCIISVDFQHPAAFKMGVHQ